MPIGLPKRVYRFRDFGMTSIGVVERTDNVEGIECRVYGIRCGIKHLGFRVIRARVLKGC